ncbi:MAG: glycosyltransferase family 1 protein [candidate division WWE3 bacterium]|nr:glycosyltransferase family 1 protein [candidate division WWE3 bacterium]
MIIGIDLTKTNFKTPVGTDVYTIEMTKALIKANLTDNFILLTTGLEAKVFWQQTLGSFSNYEIVGLQGRFLITQLQVMLASFQYRQINVLWEPVPTLPLLHRPGLRVVVTVHGEIDRSLSLRWSVKYADTIIVVSEATKTNLIRMYGQKEITIIPEGVDAAVFYPRQSSEMVTLANKYNLRSPYFLYVGTINKRKNLTNLIAAFAKLNQTDLKDHYDLVIAGSGGDIKFSISDRVKFLGRVATADLPILYSYAEATCLVSHEEGFGLPVIESLACGTPVVVSDRVGVQLDFSKVGVVVGSGSVDSIADGLIEVARLRNTNDDICQKCLTMSKRFSWEKAAESLFMSFRASASRDPESSQSNNTGHENRSELLDSGSRPE